MNTNKEDAMTVSTPLAPMTPWEVRMGFMSLAEYEEREDDHPGDDHWTVTQ